MGTKIIVEERIIGLIIEGNQNGKSLRTLSKEFGYNRTIVRNVLREKGCAPTLSNKIDIPSEELERYIVRYKQGETLSSIAKSTQFCVGKTLGYKFKKLGVELRSKTPQLSAIEAKNIIFRYRKGETIHSIARALKHDNKFISKTVPNAEIRSRSENVRLSHKRGDRPKKYKIDETVFSTLTEGSAYWIGFLMADACVHKSYVLLTLQERDAGHIEKFREFLNSSHPIKKGFSRNVQGKTYPKMIFNFSSVEIVKNLKTFGVVPRKSHIAKVKKLELNRHFWRGVIDGDGSVCLSRNNAHISLLGSQNLMTQFLAFVKTIISTEAKIRQIKKAPNTFEISFSAKSAAQIISTIYDDSNILGLTQLNEESVIYRHF